MNQKFRPYPNYKVSEIEWIDDIPFEWSELPFFVYAPQRKQSNRGMIEDNLLSLSYGKVKRRSIETASGLLPESFETYQIAERDDVVFRLTDLQNDWRSLRSARCVERGIITSAYLVVKLRGMDARYFSYLMRSYDLSKVFYALGSGLRQSLKYSDMKRLPVLVPPSDEQKQIASFLDYETAKIDALVEKQQQLIALLGEKRQAVISHAVTQGLNPDAPMRDSGVEWLDEVPEHWEIGRLSCLVETRKGIAFKSSDFVDSGLQVVKASDIKQLTIRTPTTFLPDTFARAFPKAILHAGELILSTVGSNPDVPNSAVGQLGQVPSEIEGSLLNQNTVVFSPRQDLLASGFLYFLIQADGYRDHLDLHAHGTANQSSLNVSDMLNLTIPLPGLIEQNAIANHLVHSESLMMGLVEKAEEIIDLIKERRTALISAAVTGKIDVRGWKPPPSDAKLEAIMEVA